MSTLIFQAAGQALGSALGNSFGAAIGQAAGAVVGQFVDQALFAGKPATRHVEGPRLRDLNVQTSSEGAPIPRAYGSVRLAGQLIWATRFEEQVTTRSQTTRGGKFSKGTTTTETSYAYYGNFAVGLCEGPITRIGRIWADGRPLDLSGINYRVYLGSGDQLADPLIQAKEGAAVTPAYRGLAYVVFERLWLEPFGNRLPQLSFEIFRALDDVERRIQAVNIIPGTTEFGYDTVDVTRSVQPGVTRSENRHTTLTGTDWTVSLDQLASTCPTVQSVALVVSWFGMDLRCGVCQIRPGVEIGAKATSPREWAVNGIARADAHQISQVGGKPAFGSTPSDQSVLAAIADLKTRGKKVVFYPFVMMDIPSGNTLPDPETGLAGQPAYPWRGQITCDPAPGAAGSVDKTAAAGVQVQAFFGNALPAHFSPGGGTVNYAGPAEWSFRRMILHYAHLCALAGGVDAFLIGSELVGLARVRDSATHFPSVDQLAALATDVRAILGPAAKISYAADWSDYFGYHPQDGSGDVFFHLDPVWSHPAVDFVGIDNYMPLADWRDGEGHADLAAGVSSSYDIAYLRANVAGGEGYDWYYQSAADRRAQVRTPISDGAYGKPWTFRYKDLKGWWQNEHFERIGGVERVSPTAWVPQSKPIWFTETGCPAVDKGANQPNVFVDPKSSGSAVPYFSSGARDDFIQRRYIDALTGYWDPAHPDHVAGSNPVSPLYSAPMVDPARIHIWAWDARPYPQFPYLSQVWSDGANWDLGHWITGRMGAAALDKLVARILSEYGFDAYDTRSLHRIVQGYVIDRPMSAREALEALGLAYLFDAVESGDKIIFAHYDGPVRGTFAPEDLVSDDKGPGFSLSRAQETDVPVAAQISYIDHVAGYRAAVVESRRLVGLSRREARAELPIVMSQPQAQNIADAWLRDVWTAREGGDLVLPPSTLALEPGDTVRLAAGGTEKALRLSEISDGAARRASARAIERDLASSRAVGGRDGGTGTLSDLTTPVTQFLDVPVLRLDDEPILGAAAAWADPWPGLVALYKSRDSAAFALFDQLAAPATMGEVVHAFPLPGAQGHVWNESVGLRIKLYGGSLSSEERLDVLNGENLAAVRHADGAWELLQFATATLVMPLTYDLSGLLRGQGGSEHVLAQPVAPGARFVLFDGAVQALPLAANDLRVPLSLRAGPATRDLGDPTYVEQQVVFAASGLRPLSPVHLRARRMGGDIELSWIRRSRVNADSWESADVPVGEAEERYEIDILSGGDVVRTLGAGSPQATYLAADQISDWGVQPSSLSLAVYQISDVYGRGTPLEVTINV